MRELSLPSPAVMPPTPRPLLGTPTAKMSSAVAGSSGGHLPDLGLDPRRLPHGHHARRGFGLGPQRRGHARFSFLLATPTITAVGTLDVPKLLDYAHPLYGALSARLWPKIVAYGSTAPLELQFRRREVDALSPFGYYCVLRRGSRSSPCPCCSRDIDTGLMVERASRCRQGRSAGAPFECCACCLSTRNPPQGST